MPARAAAVEAAGQPGIVAEQAAVELDADRRSGLAGGQQRVARGRGEAEQSGGVGEAPLDGVESRSARSSAARSIRKCRTRRRGRKRALLALDDGSSSKIGCNLACPSQWYRVRGPRCALCSVRIGVPRGGSGQGDQGACRQGVRLGGRECCSRRPAPAAAGMIAEPGTLCGACWPKLRFLERPWCAVMGTPFAHDMGEGFLSAEAIANPPPFARARAAVAYSGIARQMVQGLKYDDSHRVSRRGWRAGCCAPATSSSPMPTWSCRCRCTGGASCPALQPVGRARARRRPPLRQAFRAARRCRASRAPASRSGSASREREDNVRGAFKVLPQHDILVRGRRVLVVDDVYTTGATVAAVARALKTKRRDGGRRADLRPGAARGLLGG